jgi:hypothetical protein
MMSPSNVKNLANVGNEQDVIGLLKAYGDKRTPARYAAESDNNYIAWIAAGINESNGGELRNKKRSLIIDYEAKRGAFAEEEELPRDLVQEFRDMMRDMTRQMTALQKEMAELKLENREFARQVARMNPVEPPSETIAAAIKQVRRPAAPTQEN